MSKQFLTAHVVDNAHEYDIFGVAVTPSFVVTVAGDSSVRLWELSSPNHPLAHEFLGAHPIGAHHVSVNASGHLAATIGFGAEIVIWNLEQKKLQCRLQDTSGAWAVALSPDGLLLAATTCSGNIKTWDISSSPDAVGNYDTKGSFGTCIDIVGSRLAILSTLLTGLLSPDGALIASGHENGGIYVFNNVNKKIHHSLQGLVKPIRCIRFSPAGRALAACGDSNLIALFDVVSGEQIANLSGHTAWIFSLTWSSTGEFLVTGSFDGKVKVWATETRSCVATQNEASAPVYSVGWIGKGNGIKEGFVSAGANKNLYFYRETSAE